MCSGRNVVNSAFNLLRLKSRVLLLPENQDYKDCIDFSFQFIITLYNGNLPHLRFQTKNSVYKCFRWVLKYFYLIFLSTRVELAQCYREKRG